VTLDLAAPRAGAAVRRVAGRVLPVAVAVALLAFVVVAPDGPAGTWVYLAVSVAAPVCAWVGVRRRRFSGGGRWVAVTLTLNAAGDVAWQIVEWVTGSGPDVSVADLFYLASYVTLAVALVAGRLAGRRRPGASLHALLDGGACLVVALLVVYQSSIAQTLADRGHDLTVRLVWIGYPVLDAVLVGLVAWRVVLNGRIRMTALLWLCGVLCWLSADLGMLVVGDAGAMTGWMDAGWLAGVVLLAAVPWTRPSSGGDALPIRGTWRVVLNVAPFAVPAVGEVVTWVRGDRVDPVPTVVVWAVLMVLSTVRTRLMAVDVERAWGAVRSQARRYEALALNTSDAVAVVDRDGRLTSDSASLSLLLGRPVRAGEDFPGLLAALGVVPIAVHTVLDRTRRRPGTAVELELEGRTDDGGPRWLGGRAVDLSADPDVAGIVVSVYDITRRKVAEGELAHQAFHDSLTGLANRRLFLDRAEQALRRAGRTGTAPIVLCLDLDGFKDVNDSLGHQAGDALLRVVATRLLGVVRAGDTVARLGGDEFAVLLDDTASGPAAAESLAERVLDVLAEPIDLAGSTVTVGTSIGLVVAEPESIPETLLRDGDIAMYRAKAAGGRQSVTFSPGMRDAELERIELERELAGALGGGQLALAYQPVIDLRTDAVTGFEALLRWTSPTLGAVGPDRFVPIAEASGLIVPIGRWVLAEAARTAARWQREHGPDLTMAVNVSARQLADDGFLADVRSVLADSGVFPGTLVLEITETALVTDAATVGRQLAELRRMGVRIALDDFGTGYSSLSWLRTFPVDVLKIDRSFVQLLDGGGQDAAIVSGLVQLAHRLDLEVVAEGVEHEEQRERLRAEGCDLAQGWLFARALPAEEAGLLLAAPAPAR
jgi:diguanylate cyclase (GGDEF)-like protein